MTRKERFGQIRAELDQLDEKIVNLLGARRKLSMEMIRSKNQYKSQLRDQKREEDMLSRRIQLAREIGLDSYYITRIFHEIIEDSVRLQQNYLLQGSGKDDSTPIRVAFQGIEGAYSHLAAKQFFATQADRLVVVGLPAFKDVVQAVEEGDADFAMLPVENTTAGSINEVVDLLYHAKISIVGEEKFKVDHCLVAYEDVPLEKIRRILSHPQALAQCSTFINELTDCEVEAFTDTALSVKRISEERDPTQAAIGSEEATRLYNLFVIRRGIANQQGNFTRFLVVAAQPRAVDLRIPSKTSLIMATTHSMGALAEALVVFMKHEINLSDLAKRPILGSPWEVFWYVEMEGNLDEPRIQTALSDLTHHSRFLKVLGTYPTKDLVRTEPDPAAMAKAAVEIPSLDLGSEPIARPDPVPSGKGFRLASREHKKEDTLIQVKGVKLGGDEFVVIAGPCSVESREQIQACARQVKECGAQILRGGCFKPPTSPEGFEGLGWPGVEMLAAAGEEFALPVITEVLAPSDVERAARQVDLLQIGARNMQNFSLLAEVGRTNLPVMLTRGDTASLEELLHAAEYILSKGNLQVILCERGIRTFEPAAHSTLDVLAVPVLKAQTHLPIVVDPSHAAGERYLVPALVRAAKAVDAHGVMMEIHPQPENARSDGPRALHFPEFARLMADVFRS